MRDAPKITRRDVSVVRLFPSGVWEVSVVYNGFRLHSRYFGYSKRDAIALFLAEVNA
jgi:hypothetical protein